MRVRFAGRLDNLPVAEVRDTNFIMTMAVINGRTCDYDQENKLQNKNSLHYAENNTNQCQKN